MTNDTQTELNEDAQQKLLFLERLFVLLGQFPYIAEFQGEGLSVKLQHNVQSIALYDNAAGIRARDDDADILFDAVD